jgi:hypothetical protein
MNRRFGEMHRLNLMVGNEPIRKPESSRQHCGTLVSCWADFNPEEGSDKLLRNAD